METVCHNQLRFENICSKEVIANFAGGRITSDGGGLVLRELDQRYRLAEDVARCLHDPREGHKVKHDLLTLVRQHLFAIAQGYEDNDAATLAKDPAFKIMAGKAPESDGDLASQPTLSRFENRVNAKDLRRLFDRLLELFTSRPIPAPGRPSSWTWTPPRTPPTGSSNSASSTVITKSICIIPAWGQYLTDRAGEPIHPGVT